MPIYEYRCSDCGFQDEFLQKLSDPPMSLCPSCGKESLKKLLSAAGFQLKGSGWYATDFKGSGSQPAGKSAGSKKLASGGESGASESKGAESKTSESKPSGESSTSNAAKAPPVSASS